MLTSQIFSDFDVHHLLICVLCRMQYVVCIALLLFDYNGQLLVHVICLVVLFFCHFMVLLLFFERNKWRWRWRYTIVPFSYILIKTDLFLTSKSTAKFSQMVSIWHMATTRLQLIWSTATPGNAPPSSWHVSDQQRTRSSERSRSTTTPIGTRSRRSRKHSINTGSAKSTMNDEAPKGTFFISVSSNPAKQSRISPRTSGNWQSCAFEHLEDSLIRDRIIIGIRDDPTRHRLLQQKNVTLANAIDACKASHQSATSNDEAPPSQPRSTR